MASGPGTALVIINAISFGKAKVYGEGADCYLFGTDAHPQGHAFLAAAAAFTSGAKDMRGYNRIGMQLVTENAVDPVVIGASDTSVVASTKTFTIAGYDFTGKTNAIIHIRGDVAHAGNNGDFVVSSVTSAHVVVCTTASGLANETFDPTTTTITVERADAPLTGDWKVEVSNDFVPAGNGSYGQSPQAGRWTDITAAFTPAIDAVTDVSDQYIQADLSVRSIRATFTPTA
jgi:hypothetical protein